MRPQSTAASTDSHDRKTRNRYEVIVVGAGFAGTAVAQELGRKGVEVLLVDSNSYHQFQPLLYQLATSQIGVSAIARPIRSIFRRLGSVNIMTAAVTTIDSRNRTVTLGDGETLHADQTLVVALGGVPNYFDTPGAEEHAYPLYSLEDATRLATRLTRIFDHAANHPEETVDIVVVGGGPTGVETAGAIAEHINYVVRKYFSPDLTARSKVHLVDMVSTVLAPFSPNLQEYTKDRLSALGVQLHLGVGVAEVRTNAVKLADGSEIPAQLTVWAGGLKAGRILQDSGLPQGKGGRIDVLPDLTVPDQKNVYVLGDAANITDSERRKLPQLGSVAQQSGKWAARNIYRDINGGPREPFHYVDKGYMAMIGRGAAVAEIGRKRLQLRGAVAFLSWLLVHLALLSGAQQKVRAMFSWVNGYILHSPAQVVVGNREDGPSSPAQ
ncbi:NADH dehydrogenase [Arthrobacter sp. Soil782]|uniref:NAD(P)/FAD-dependent oxidoreductase n=1 Tax=Arthrobacter sp. Soil782 TaxID=1736410 RepID=UPI0006F5A444|nr:NADH dehydrogenase [Arthrobacter sp. Soil782]